MMSSYILGTCRQQYCLKMAKTSLILNSGHEMPLVGLGTWKSANKDVQAAVEYAIDCGYRHLDCAWIYGNEVEVGIAVANKIKEGKVKREELFITSKLWNLFHNPKDVRPTLLDTLKKLQLEYLDLYLVHHPVGFRKREEGDTGSPFTDEDYVDTWKAMEEMKKEGLARSIGVSNFNEYQIQRVINEASIVPAVNQIELHPFLNQRKLVDFCQKNSVAVTSYGCLGSYDHPRFAGKWNPEDVLLTNSKLVEIAKRLNKTVAHILLRFQIQRNVIVIPKSVTPTRIKANFEVFDFELTNEDMEVIFGLERNFRVNNWVFPTLSTLVHKYNPFQENYSE